MEKIKSVMLYLVSMPIFFYISDNGVPALSDVPGIDVSPNNQYAIPLIALLYISLLTKRIKTTFLDIVLAMPCVSVVSVAAISGVDNLRFYLIPFLALGWLIVFNETPRNPVRSRLLFSKISGLIALIYCSCAIITFPDSIPYIKNFPIYNLYQYGPYILSTFLLIHIGLNKKNLRSFLLAMLGTLSLYILSDATDGAAFKVFTPFLLVIMILAHLPTAYGSLISNLTICGMILVVFAFPILGVYLHPTEFHTLDIRFGQFEKVFEGIIYLFNPFQNEWRLNAHGSMHNELIEMLTIFGIIGPLILLRIYYKLWKFLKNIQCSTNGYVIVVVMFSGLTILPIFNLYFASLFILIPLLSKSGVKL